MDQSEEKSMFKELWDRRLPQFFATYIGVCFGILQFIIFACGRYNINDSLIDKFLLFAVLLVPAVLLYIYNHGKPGKDNWTKFEKAALPSNLMIALIAAFFIGDSGTTASAATTIEITTDDGEQVTRYIPAASETRDLALFPLDMKTEDDDWARYGVPHLLSLDMEQDVRLSTRTMYSMNYHFESFGYQISDRVPFSTKLKIANKIKVDYFLEGTLEKQDGIWMAHIKVYETGSGELFQEKSKTNSNLFELVDAVSQELSADLFLKDNDSEFNKFVDLPASDLISSNEEALALYIQGMVKMRFSDAYQEALSMLTRAADLDNKSAEIKVAASQAFATLGDQENSKKLMSSALSLSKQLPERQQFSIKRGYYNVNQEIDKILLMMENWVKLYPQDFEPYRHLIDFYRRTYQLSKAKDAGLLAISNGHRTKILSEMADLSIQLNELEDAEKYIKEYHQTYPELVKEDTRLADVYIKKGQFSKAVDFYNKHLLDDPQNSRLHNGIAQVYAASGNLLAAEKSFNQALEFAEIPQDSASVLSQLLFHHSTYGHRAQLLKVSDQWINCLRGYMPEISVASSLLQFGSLYNKVGAGDVYKSFFEDFGKSQPQMKSTFDCLHNFILNMSGDDLEEFKKYNHGECRAMAIQGSPDLEYMINGFEASLEGEHQKAIENFNIFIEKSGSGGKEFGYLLAKEYRLMKKYDKAVASCLDYLKTNPNSTDFLFELALAQKAKNDLEGGKKTYAVLSKLWKDADPQFMNYQEFQELGKIFK